MCRGTEAHQRGHVRYTQIRGAFEARAGVHKKTWPLGSRNFFLGVRGFLGWKVGARSNSWFWKVGAKSIRNIYGSLVRAYWGHIESYWKYWRVLVVGKISPPLSCIKRKKRAIYNFEALDSKDSQWNKPLWWGCHQRGAGSQRKFLLQTGHLQYPQYSIPTQKPCKDFC